MYKIINIKQGTDEWLKARAGKISWTKLYNVMSWDAAQKTLIYSLIAEELASLEEPYTNQYMERGIMLEWEAAEEYNKKYKKVKLSEVWLIQKNDYQVISPDRVIFNKKWKITKAIEIKCLSSSKHVRYLSVKNFIEVYKIEKLYFWQVVNYFVVIDSLKSLDFVLYNPDFYKKKYKLHIIKVKRSEIDEFIKLAKERIEEFRQKRIEVKKTI